ncbi:MAG: DsbA family oxidoreductase [Thiovulaceae bacterium]|nr:DsbA family oxidoreductase [Sulfurimonadaceae bacterium]
MTDKLKIEIISDVVCPWCIIGYKRLEQAMKELGVEDKFEILWHPFELNPNMPSEGEDFIEHIQRKYGMSAEQVRNSVETSKKNFDEVNFPLDYYEGKRMVNTRDAHVLLDFAKELGKQHELEIALFKANFGERKDVSDHNTLAQIVKSVGLDPLAVMARLDDLNARKNVQDKEDYWRGQGVSAVPTMIFNQAQVMNGAYPVENYKQVLRELLTIGL